MTATSITDSPALAVVTRPAPDHHALSQALRARGFAVLHCPAFEIRPLPDELRAERTAELAGFDLVIVTSPHAARVLRATRDDLAALDVRWLAPGVGTAANLQAAGCRVEVPASGGTSEDLLALPVLNEIAGRRIAIIAAPGGRMLLGDTLRQRGAEVERLYLYERRPAGWSVDAERSLLAAGDRLWLLVSSTAVLDGLLRQAFGPLRSALLNANWVLSSARLAQHAEAAGLHRLIVAGAASDEAMLAALDGIGGRSDAEY
ncbi:MAG: uroporphyrinogen-III synthase [Wenzhouxiangellaceae bacterium]|nr:uroporphyrinogen-III synthase [Wenzhouxiangellaceae bacterium]